MATFTPSKKTTSEIMAGAMAHITMKLTIPRRWRFRLWLGRKIIEFGGKVCGIGKLEIETQPKTDRIISQTIPHDPVSPAQNPDWPKGITVPIDDEKLKRKMDRICAMLTSDPDDFKNLPPFGATDKA